MTEEDPAKENFINNKEKYWLFKIFDRFELHYLTLFLALAVTIYIAYPANPNVFGLTIVQEYFYQL